MWLHIQRALSMKAVSHDKLKRYEPAMKKQPADNKASEARRVGGPCSITQSFHWKPDASGFILFSAH